MVLDVSITEVEEERKIIRVYPAYVPDFFAVHVDSKRILTVLTDNDNVASKWLTEVLRSKSTNTKPLASGSTTTFPPDSIFVGLVAEEEHPFYGPRPYDATDHCLDLLTLCVGSHCLMYEFSGGHYDPHWDLDPPYEDSPKLFKAFFQNPRVVVLGTDMAKVSKRLEARHGIKIKNAVDLNQLAVKRMQRHDLDLVRYDFEKLTMTVLGKKFDVIKPDPVYWYPREAYSRFRDKYYYCTWSSGQYRLSDQKIMFTTVDAYLRLLMCFKLLEAMDGSGECSSSKKKMKMKNSKKKITKRSQ